MELRERSKGGTKGMLEVERRLLKGQEQQTKRIQKEENRQAQSKNVFDILNSKLAGIYLI